MTKKGWKNVLISERVYELLKEYIKTVNNEKGFAYFSSIRHCVDNILMEHFKENFDNKKGE